MKLARRVLVLMLVALFGGTTSSTAVAQTPDLNCTRDGIDDKCEAWVTTFDDNELADVASDSPVDIAVSPDGNSVYQAVRTTVGTGFDAKSRWAVLAYDSTGQRQWLARWGSPDKHNFPTSIAVSRDGELVFVSGSWRTDQLAVDGHLTTVAFDAESGEIVWTANYDGPGGGTDNARDILVHGRTLYIAGISAGRDNSDLDYAAIAYDMRTGGELWVSRWDGIGIGNTDSPFAIDTNSKGDMLYLTGWSYGEGEFNNDYGTIAVDTKGEDAGRIAWTARYDGVGVHAPDQASALTVAPDDRTVFVTGMSDDVEGGPPFDVNYGYATVAYDAVTGEQLWEARKQWPGTNFNSPNAITVDPTNQRLVVTGQAGQRQLDFGTVTYDPQSGEEVWSDLYGLQEYDFEFAKNLALDPRGDAVYVTGVSAKSPPGIPGVVLYAPNADELTIAYDVMTGQRKWLARFNPSTTDYVSVQSMAVSPDATKVYTAASIDDQNWDNDGDDFDAGLIAYEIGPGIPIPVQSILELTDESESRGQYSDATTFAARLTSSAGDPIARALLSFEVQGATTSAITDAEGVATIRPTLEQAPGQYPLRVTYDGDQEHEPVVLEDTFTIESEDTILVFEVDRKSRTLRATLTDQDSSVGIRGREVVFYFKDEVIGRATTNDSGVAELHQSPKSAKSYRAGFEGDGFYKPSAAP